MDPFFAWIENSVFSTFLRSSPSAFVFPAMLSLHALGMALLVGTQAAIAVRVLGAAPRVPLSALLNFVPLAWLGLAANVVSGVLLLIAYPTKALTNPLFYGKLGFVALSLFLFWEITKALRAASPDGGTARRTKILAAAVLAGWAITIAAGRFLAYTYSRLLVDLPGGVV